MGFPFTFAKRPTEKLGVGVSDLAFGRPSTLPLQLWVGNGGIPVVRNLEVVQPRQVFSPQKTTPVSLRGNGVYLSEQMLHQGLMDLEARQKSSTNKGVF